MLFDGLLLKRDDPGEVREGADSRGVAEFLVGRNFEAELDDALDMWKDNRHFRLHQLVKNLQRLASLFLDDDDDDERANKKKNTSMIKEQKQEDHFENMEGKIAKGVVGRRGW